MQPENPEEQKDISSQDTALFQLLASSLAPYKKWLFVATFLMVATAALNVVPPYLLQQAIDGPIARGDTAVLMQLTILYGITAFGIFGLTFAFTYFLQQAGQRAMADLRSRLFDHIFGQEHAFFNKNPTGDLVSRLTTDIDTLSAVLSTSVVTILVEGVTLIVIVVVMFVVNWRLAILALVVMPVLAVVTRYFRQRIRRSSSGERSAQARISAFLNEHLNAMTVVQLFGHQDESEQEFDVYNNNYRQALIVLRHHSAVFLSVQEILAAVGLGLLLYGGGQGVLAGWATLGTLVAFIQYTERAFQPILKLSQEYNSVQIALGAAERIHRMLQSVSHIQSPAQPVSLTSVRGEIELQNIHFAYVPDEPVLRGVSLHIPPGQSVAIAGATGAGKSSLAGLLARNYDPQRGRVLLDGVDIRALNLHDLRRVVAVVPQDPVCLHGTIRRNIALYRQDITEAEIRRAAEFSNAAHFIEDLPDGYDFEVLPGGANLSQGQRQLLALARALALSPEGVLILDEATSSIDTATETLIQEALSRILRSRTSLVIAHRLSTIRDADRIIVMDRGKIVEDGTHHTLLGRGGFYARLHAHHTSPQPEPSLA